MGVQNLSGQTLGQYELRELVGAGGMGAVYLANQTTLERLVAVKVLNIALVQDPDYTTRFNREAKTSASLEHPHIVPVYDYGTQNGVSYVVMRYLTGGSLAERLNYSRDTGRSLPSLPETAVSLKQLASALDYAHSRGVIHRDVKTNNVMFDDQGTAFLVDFGIAKLTFATSALTGTGMAMGTPSYMAPEQWRGETVTPAADQYALGVLTFAMLTGRMPFEAETPFALMHKHLNEEPTPLGAFRSDLSEGIRAVLNRALAKDPTARYETCSDYANAFEQALMGTAAESTRFFLTPLPKKQFLADQPTSREQAGSVGKQITAIPPVKVVAPDDETSMLGKQSLPRSRIMGIAIGLIIVLVLGSILVLLLTQRENWPYERDLTATNLMALNSTAFVQLTQTSIAGSTFIAETQTARVLDLSLTPAETPTPTDTATLEVRAAAAATRDAFLTATATLWTPTLTPDVEQTFAAELTALFLQDLTATADLWTATATFTATATATLTPTATDTVDVRSVAQSTRNAIATMTATQWTPTLTPDVEQTLSAELTMLFAQDLTETATLWTDTPVPTATPTLTSSPTDTIVPTDTSTITPTPSNTLRPTFTPTNSLTPRPILTSTPTSAPVISCPGVRQSRLYAGVEGYVLADDLRPVNVRRGAGTEFTIRGQLNIGETFTVLDGPTCSNQYAWFQISARSGAIEGWIAEGDADAYFVAPSGVSDPTQENFLQARCRVIVQDDFEGDTSGNDWFIDTTDRYVIDIYNGGYNLQINFLRDGGVGDPQGESLPTLWGSLRGEEFGNASIEAVITSSTFTLNSRARTGLWVKYQGDNAFIAVMIRGDGAYRISKYTDDRFSDLVPWTLSSAINVGNGVANTLRIDMQGDQIDLYINGVYVDTVYDDTWETGRVAFWGASPNTPVTFKMDYFRACEN